MKSNSPMLIGKISKPTRPPSCSVCHEYADYAEALEKLIKRQGIEISKLSNLDMLEEK